MLDIVKEIEKSDEFQKIISIVGSSIGVFDDILNIVDYDDINSNLLNKDFEVFIESDEDGYETPIENVHYFYAIIYYHYKGFILKNTFYTVGNDSYEFTDLEFVSLEINEITESKVTL